MVDLFFQNKYQKKKFTNFVFFILLIIYSSYSSNSFNTKLINLCAKGEWINAPIFKKKPFKLLSNCFIIRIFIGIHFSVYLICVFTLFICKIKSPNMGFLHFNLKTFQLIFVMQLSNATVIFVVSL